MQFCHCITNTIQQDNVMSIFRNTLQLSVQAQLKARQKALSSRTPDAIIQANTRNSWVRMTSAVDVSGDGGKLAKQYVMLGGILDNKQLRYGVGDQSHAYSTTSPSGIPYNNPNARAGAAGIKPMPGITSIDIKSGTAYGSLRTVTVNFVCHNLQQLEDLELLYMRQGYTALVEWGWAPYLKNNDKLETNIKFYDDVLNGGKQRDEVFLELYKLSREQDHNYDAMYGYIKNYNWTARMDGGYNCQTVIVSIGEIMESLKVSYLPYDIDGIIRQKGLLGLLPQSAAALTPGTPSLSLEAYSKNILAGLCREIYDYCADPVNFTTDNAFPKLPKQATIPSIAFYNYDLFKFDYKTTEIPNSLASSGKQVYITLKSFVQLLNDFVMLYAGTDEKTAKPFITISTNSNTYETGSASPLLCLAHPLQVSVDPTICLVTNNIWAKGVTFDGVNASNNTSGTEYLKILAKGNIPFENEKETGFIGNIYLNIDFLYRLSIEPSLLDPKTQDLKLFNYIKSVLKSVQESIGGVNNFEIHVDPIDSVARIIDLNYVDVLSKTTAYDKAFQIEMHNLSGNVRSYELQSQIFPEQGAMIAIGAQVQATSAQGTAASSLLDFNYNLYDRILGKKDDSPSSKSTAFNNNINVSESFNRLKTNLNIINEFFFEPPTILDNGQSVHNQEKTSEYKNSLKNIITYFQETVKSNTAGRAIIPVKLSLTMDGIGGLIIGHLFKIPPSLLPRGYGSDNVGSKLIQTITSIGHKVENGDWTTTIDSLNITTKEPSGITATFNDLLTETKTGFIVKIPKLQEGTPNADNLKNNLKTLGYNVKGDELSNGGDISKEIATVGIAVAKKIKEKLPTIGIIFTSGNDKFHQNLSYNSRHKAGNAIDLTVTPATSNNLNAVKKIIQGFAAGNVPNFKFIDEYSNPTKKATGGHFHLSWGQGSEGFTDVAIAIGLANKNEISKYSI